MSATIINIIINTMAGQPGDVNGHLAARMIGAFLLAHGGSRT
jgi:hypothetical protein